MNSVNSTTGVALNILIVNTVTKNVEDSWVVGLTIPVNVMNVWELRMIYTDSKQFRDLRTSAQTAFRGGWEAGIIEELINLIEDQNKEITQLKQRLDDKLNF